MFKSVKVEGYGVINVHVEGTYASVVTVEVVDYDGHDVQMILFASEVKKLRKALKRAQMLAQRP